MNIWIRMHISFRQQALGRIHLQRSSYCERIKCIVNVKWSANHDALWWQLLYTHFDLQKGQNTFICTNLLQICKLTFKLWNGLHMATHVLPRYKSQRYTKTKYTTNKTSSNQIKLITKLWRLCLLLKYLQESNYTRASLAISTGKISSIFFYLSLRWNIIEAVYYWNG